MKSKKKIIAEIPYFIFMFIVLEIILFVSGIGIRWHDIIIFSIGYVGTGCFISLVKRSIFTEA